MAVNLHNVDNEFFKVWFGDDLNIKTLLLTTHAGKDIEVLIRYGKNSAEDLVEEAVKRYPVITIVPSSPKARKDLLRSQQPILSALRDVGDTGKLNTGSEFEYPIPFDFVYEVFCAAKSESHMKAIQEYVFNKFGVDGQKHFLFNSFSVPLVNDSLNENIEVGESVYYDLESDDIPRSDGVHEMLFKFKLLVWVAIKTPKDFDLLEQININSDSITIATITQPDLT